MSFGPETFQGMFFEEAAEHLDVVEAGLLALDAQHELPGSLEAVFRATHSIKGASSLFGFTAVTDFAHLMEGVFDQVRSGRTAWSGELTSLLLEANDTLGHLVLATKSGDPTKVRRADVTTRLERVLQGERPSRNLGPPPRSPPGPIVDRVVRIAIDPSARGMELRTDALLLIAEVRRLGEVLAIHCDTSQLPPFATLDERKCYLRWTIRLKTTSSDRDIEEIFSDLADAVVVTIVTEEQSVDSSPANRVRADRRRSEPAAIRVSAPRIKGLIDLANELASAQALVERAIERLPPPLYPDLHEANAIVARSARELQEQVRAIQLIPIAALFNRFPRLVRDLGDNLGLDLRVEIAGDEVEIDRDMLERLGDPLTHLLRNAVGHGIEPPWERGAAGKSPRGTIRLAAKCDQSGGVVVEVSDDGRGLPVAKIRAKAIEQGLIATASDIPEEQLYRLIFHPGFSTADGVTEISGRGVGMDVVKRSVDSLGGTISIATSPGQGTQFRIWLPSVTTPGRL